MVDGAESILWRAYDDLPDSDTTVLVAAAGGIEPVWLGYFNGEKWVTIEGYEITVTHWADLPQGPK